MDRYYMQQALLCAQVAAQNGEVPIGCVVVDETNTIIGSGFNQVETFHCQSRHAEVVAIEEACKKINNWRLANCRLYVTLEPCSMCMNLLLLSRIPEVIFALRSEKFGFMLDRYNSFELYQGPIVIREGVCAQESHELLRVFFQEKRERKRE